MIELDLNTTNPEYLREYESIQVQIDDLCKGHKNPEKNPMSEQEHIQLRELLRQRAQIMSKILNCNVYPVK